MVQQQKQRTPSFTRTRRREPVEDPEFSSSTLEIRRVSRMVAGGRRFRFRALVAVGNKKGSVGIGMGKAVDVPKAVEKATRKARASMIYLPLKKGTILRDILIKHGTARILFRPAKPGHGIVAGGVTRTLCELSGITDISAKVLSRSTNSLVNAQAAMKAFRHLAEWANVAEGRRSKPVTSNS
jgi:small subunit ribosomal protein S5